MAGGHPKKWHLRGQNLLIFVSYTAAVVSFCALTMLPPLASSQIQFPATCVGADGVLQLCVGAKPKGGRHGASANNNKAAVIHNNEAISGPLPREYFSGFVSKLSYLALANNNLTGPIPTSIGHMRDTLLEIVLLNNQLSGCIPGELGMLSKAAVIDAGENQLTGPIPLSFSCLSSVEQLNLAGNRLGGRVPDALCRLAAGRLGNLTLRGNYLSAVGPACTALVEAGVLDVSGNCIAGMANQRHPAECVAFQLRQPRTTTCPDTEASAQLVCPDDAAATSNAGKKKKKKGARDYYSYLTYASLRD